MSNMIGIAAMLLLVTSIVSAQQLQTVNEAGKSARLNAEQQFDQQGIAQYERLIEKARGSNELASNSDPSQIRLAAQLARINGLHLSTYLQRSADWRWEISLIGSKSIDAFAMPGGKLVVYSGWLEKVSPTDDELLAMVATLTARLLLDLQREQAPALGVSGGLIQLGGLTDAVQPLIRRHQQQIYSADALARRLLSGLNVGVEPQIEVLRKSSPASNIGALSWYPSTAQRVERLRALELTPAAQSWK